MPTQFEVGFLIGLLVGEGHFGGDGRQPHVTLRMHVRHEPIFRWLERTFPGGRLYGPYHHGGRHYLQWMARGPFLRDELAPLLDRHLSPDLDRYSFDRFQLMKAHYPEQIGDLAPGGGSAVPSASRGAVPTTTTARTSNRPVSTRATPGVWADDHGPDSGSPSSARPASGPETFDDLFTQLREAWPS